MVLRRFPALAVSQPIGTFYLTVMSPAQLMDISFPDRRHLVDAEFEEYTGIQRQLNPKRIEELADYVNTIDAAFPTAIIVAIDDPRARYDHLARELEIPGEERIARMLDGQHRLAGLELFNGTNFDLNVAVFLHADIEDQAHLFATINLAQTKVSKSLAYDLYALATSRSPQKIGHITAKVLNGREGSPFFHSIKILGTSRKGRVETLTQALVVQQLLKCVTSTPIRDRDTLKRGKNIERPSAADLKKLPLRGLFFSKKDAEITANIWNYFKAVSTRWPQTWQDLSEGNIIRRSTGFISFMRLFRSTFPALQIRNAGDVVSATQFASLFESSTIPEGGFLKTTYVPGGSGIKELYKKLLSEAVLPTSEILPFDEDEQEPPEDAADVIAEPV